jgi:hypothetical protein
MDRRLVIATIFLALALLCLVPIGLSSATSAAGAAAVPSAPSTATSGSGAPAGVSLPQPSPVGAPQVAGAGSMSGEFADTHLA